MKKVQCDQIADETAVCHPVRDSEQRKVGMGKIISKKSKRKSKGERNRVLSSTPNKNKTNPDGKSEFVLFFTRDYFGVICKFRK